MKKAVIGEKQPVAPYNRPANGKDQPAKAEEGPLAGFFRLTKWPGAIIFNQ
ncbi:MAG TPA: hypothetical protein VIL22_08490 [Paenibacillaceae bacterium]